MKKILLIGKSDQRFEFLSKIPKQSGNYVIGREPVQFIEAPNNFYQSSLPADIDYAVIIEGFRSFGDDIKNLGSIPSTVYFQGEQEEPAVFVKNALEFEQSLSKVEMRNDKPESPAENKTTTKPARPYAFSDVFGSFLSRSVKTRREEEGVEMTAMGLK